jgi:hypothetical protein
VTRATLALTLGLAIGAPGCAPDLLLSASNLEITPNPAQAGQAVTFTFTLTVIPGQGFTIIVLIDGTEHSRLTRFEAVEDRLIVVDLGDAAALISRYGLGTHIGGIEVRLHDQNRTAGTATKMFELQNAPPPVSRAQ